MEQKNEPQVNQYIRSLTISQGKSEAEGMVCCQTIKQLDGQMRKAKLTKLAVAV